MMHFIQSFFGFQRRLDARKTDGLIDVDEFIHFFAFIRRVLIHFMKQQRYGNVVGISGDEKAVDESRRCLWSRSCDDEQRLIEIGGDDLRFLREVDRFADDVILSRVDVRDVAFTLILECVVYMIAGRNRIGGGTSFEPNFSAHLTYNGLSVLSEDVVVFSR